MSENPYSSPIPNRDDTQNVPDSKSLGAGWKLLMLVLAVCGYMVARVVRQSLGLTGVIPGAIFGALGVGGGYLIGAGIVALFRPTRTGR